VYAPEKKQNTYRLHGLCLRSEVELPAALDDCSCPDFTVKWGDHANVADELPDGFVLARMSFAGGRGFVHARTRIGYTLRFPAICEFQVDCVRQSMTVHVVPGANPDNVPLLLVGNVMGFFLSMAGECLLHASAVEIDGVALAFVGQSGSGKSTLASLFCAGGARLVSDDVLRLKFGRRTCRCFPGTLELRLRSGAEQVARYFPRARQRPTVDERIAIRPNDSDDLAEHLPLRAIVIPRVTRGSDTPHVRRLWRAEALFGLTRCPGMIGWQVDEPIRQQFQALGHTVRTVPVYEATIPWGPPHSPQLPDELLRSLD
jgi:hypothetical protein